MNKIFPFIPNLASTQSTLFIVITFLLFSCIMEGQNKMRARDYGIEIGVLPTGPTNSIVDVPGVKVGHVTFHNGLSLHTGVTAILAHGGNLFQQKVPAAIYIANGFGKLAGYSQVKELGNIETPIILTNTLSVPIASKSLIEYTLDRVGNENVRSVNPVVGETNDGYLNDIRSLFIDETHVRQAITEANSNPPEEGNVGAGAGTSCFGFKGGIGTSSRELPESLGGYTVGVIVQSNFGGILEIKGAPIGKELGIYPFKKEIMSSSDGSCMIVVMTDAPLDARNLERLAKRAILGLGKTGGIMSNGSGDYVIAVSTAEELRIPYQVKNPIRNVNLVENAAMSPLFLAVIEATEEAIINSLFAAETVEGYRGKREALPLENIIPILKKYGVIK